MNVNEVQNQKPVQNFSLYLNELGTEIFLWIGALIYHLQPTECVKWLTALIEYCWKGIHWKKKGFSKSHVTKIQY